MIVLRNTKKVARLQTQKAYFNTLVYRLYKNDYTPTGVMTNASFTEVDDGGYVPRAAGGFGDAFLNSITGRAEIKAAEWITVLDHDGGDYTVYGWYATDPDDGTVFAAERFATPVVVDVAQKCVAIVPYFALSNLAS